MKNIYIIVIITAICVFTSCREEKRQLYFSIDNRLQSMVEDNLKSNFFLPCSDSCMDNGEVVISGCGVDEVSAIVLDVESGAVLALASINGDTPGSVRCNDIYCKDNLAYKQIELGGLLHLATLASLLEDNYISIKSRVDAGSGRWSANGRTYTDAHPVGEVSVKEAFASSSNIAFAKLVQEHYSDNPQKFVDNLNRYFSLS